jgi:hypothetical protein
MVQDIARRQEELVYEPLEYARPGIMAMPPRLESSFGSRFALSLVNLQAVSNEVRLRS